jgi:hypothetical protein
MYVKGDSQWWSIIFNIFATDLCLHMRVLFATAEAYPQQALSQMCAGRCRVRSKNSASM